MDKYFLPTLYLAGDCLSMLGLKLSHVSKGDPGDRLKENCEAAHFMTSYGITLWFEWNLSPVMDGLIGGIIACSSNIHIVLANSTLDIRA